MYFVHLVRASGSTICVRVNQQSSARPIPLVLKPTNIYFRSISTWVSNLALGFSISFLGSPTKQSRWRVALNVGCKHCAFSHWDCQDNWLNDMAYFISTSRLEWVKVSFQAYITNQAFTLHGWRHVACNISTWSATSVTKSFIQEKPALTWYETGARHLSRRLDGSLTFSDVFGLWCPIHRIVAEVLWR